MSNSQPNEVFLFMMPEPPAPRNAAESIPILDSRFLD